MISECCILCLHHRDDSLTRHHLRLLREHNPFDVIPIHAHQHEYLADAVDIGSIQSPWHAADEALLRWFRQRPRDSACYILVEYDTLVTMSLRDFYGTLWNHDAVVAHIRVRQFEPAWEWFAQIPLLPDTMQPLALGVSPMSPILLSHRALQAISEFSPPPVFSELRLGTLLRAAGIPITALPPERSANIHWNPTTIRIDPSKPGVYHPVKAIIPQGN